MELNDKEEFLKRVCGNTWAVLSRVENGQVKVSKIRLRCRSWLCEPCRKKRAKGFANATFNFFSSDTVRLLTITDSHRGTIEGAYETFAKRWNHFRTHLTRQIGKFKYVRVLEAQPKSGFPHYHVLLNRYVAPEVLNEALAISGFGYITDIREITSDDGFFYVLKYLKKEWSHREALAICQRLHIRRCSGSVGFSIGSASVSQFKLLGIYQDHVFCSRLVNELYKTLMSAGCKMTAVNDSEDFFELIMDPPGAPDPLMLGVACSELEKLVKQTVAMADWTLPQ